MIMMDSKAQLTVDIIAKVAESKITINNAALLENNESIAVKRETLRSWAHDIHHVKRAKARIKA